MTSKKFTAIRLEEDLLDGLRQVYDRDGISVSEQMRRAVRDWLQKKDIIVKSAPRRAVTRRKA